MNAHDVHHLAAAYALDALDLQERQIFEAHYPDCDVCRTEVAEFRETAAVLASETESAPPAALKSDVMAKISRTRQLSPLVDEPVRSIGEGRRSSVSRYVLMAAAAIVLAAGISAASLFVTRSSTDEIGELVAASDATVSKLGPLADDATANLRVVSSDEQAKVAVIGNDLTAPGEGRTYALWFVDGSGGVSPAGLFEPDEDGMVRIILPLDGKTDAGWGVTIEPDGGSPQPTSDVLYLGEL